MSRLASLGGSCSWYIAAICPTVADGVVPGATVPVLDDSAATAMAAAAAFTGARLSSNGRHGPRKCSRAISAADSFLLCAVDIAVVVHNTPQPSLPGWPTAGHPALAGLF